MNADDLKRGLPAMIVIPCLNEAEHIEALIERLAVPSQRLDMRIVVVDGGSTDGTQRDRPRGSPASTRASALLDNPKKIQSAADQSRGRDNSATATTTSSASTRMATIRRTIATG